MSAPIISKILFTVTFPVRDGRLSHIPAIKLRSLARNQMSDMDVINTIEHLFKCSSCFETYRWIRTACQARFSSQST